MNGRRQCGPAALAAAAAICWSACGGGALTPTLRVQYGTHPAQRIHVFIPPEPTGPVVLLIHGGGWKDGSLEEWTSEFVTPFLDHGWTVAAAGYRQSGEAAAPAAISDVSQAGFATAEGCRQWRCDAGRLAAVGFSAGGHLALMAALAPEEIAGRRRARFRAVVSFWGITDVADLCSRNFRQFALEWMPAFDSPEEKMEAAARWSPLRYAAGAAIPILAIHSRFDPVVPFDHSRLLVEAVVGAGGRGRLIELSHRGHAVRGAALGGLYRQMFQWMNEDAAL